MYIRFIEMINYKTKIVTTIKISTNCFQISSNVELQTFTAKF